MKASLSEIGHACDIAVNALAPDCTNILLGYHLLKYEESIRRFRYIPYQLEQLGAQQHLYSTQVQNMLEGALEVWDYSQDNIAFLAERGINAKYLPVGYHRTLERIPHAPNKNIDILFYGSMNERRREVLKELDRLGVKNIKTLFGVYSEERDRWIGQSKIVLNIHHYPLRIFETVRVSYLLNNRIMVVSEDSPVYPYEGVPMALSPYESLGQTCLRFLNDTAAMSSISHLASEEFKSRYAMTSLLQTLL